MNQSRIIIIIVGIALFVTGIVSGYFLGLKKDIVLKAPLNIEADTTKEQPLIVVQDDSKKDIGKPRPSLIETRLPLKCPPSGESIKSKWNFENNYIDIFLNCGDGGGLSSSHVILNDETTEEILFYQISNFSLSWELKNDLEYTLKALEDDQGCESGIENCTMVISDLLINGVKQNIINEPLRLSYDPTAYGWYGLFSGAEFNLNNKANGGVLEVEGLKFNIDFINNSISEVGRTTWQTYKNDKLKITLSYPKEWGEVNQKVEPDHIVLTVFDNDVFLGADNGEESVARGSYWGDYSELIINQNYINTFCNGKSDCKIKTNQNGITFAREKEKDFSSLGNLIPHESIFYYIFNPKSEFRGIILSNERLVDEGIESLESKMDLIVDSLNFID